MRRWLAIIQIGIISTFLPSCSGECENISLNKSRHPDSNLSAIAFNRSCGATTADSFQISITSGEEPGDSGNVLIADNVPSDFIEKHPPLWASKYTYMVYLPREARIFKIDNKVSGINIIVKKI